MRIVIFNAPDRITVYPFEGVSAFGRTRKVGPDIVGEYFGTATDVQLPNYGGVWPIVPVSYRTEVTQGELITLFGQGPYAKVHRAAYPPGSSPADDDALFFMEQVRAAPTVNVTSPDMQAALANLQASGYIDPADNARIQQGVRD